MTIPLADSELQEISAAYKEAEAKIMEAGLAMEKLLSTLEEKAAFISDGKIAHLRNINVPTNAIIFRVSVQRHLMMKYGTERAFEQLDKI